MSGLLTVSDKTVRAQLVDVLHECGLITDVQWECSEDSETISFHIQNDDDSDFWWYLMDNFVICWDGVLFCLPKIIDRAEEWDSLYSNLSKNVKKEVLAYITSQHPTQDQHSMYSTYIFTVEDVLEFAAFYHDASQLGFVYSSGEMYADRGCK